MELKKIEWTQNYEPEALYIDKLGALSLIGTFPCITNCFYISNWSYNYEGDGPKIDIGHKFYLKRTADVNTYIDSVNVRWILHEFNTLEEAKEEAQKICFEWVKSKFFQPDIIRNVLFEKTDKVKNLTQKNSGEIFNTDRFTGIV